MKDPYNVLQYMTIMAVSIIALQINEGLTLTMTHLMIL